VDRKISKVPDIFAASLTTAYDSAVALYDSLATSGSVLSCDCAAIEALEERQSGQATIELSRKGLATGCDAVGTQRLVRFFFSKVGSSGSSKLTFGSAKLLGSETLPQEKTGIEWVRARFENR